MALFGAPRAFLGLDIASSTISLVEIVDRVRRRELVTYAVVARPLNATAVELSDLLAEAMQRAQISADVAALSLPNTELFSVAFQLPDMPPDQRARAINFKAAHVIPMDPAAIKLSWVESRRRDGGIDVFVTATPKQSLTLYQQAAKKLNLEVAAIEPEIFPLIRVHNLEPQATALFGSIDQVLTLHLVTDSFPRGALTVELPLTPEGTDRLRQFVAGHHIDRLLVHGTGVRMPNLIETLEGAFGVESELSNPWHDVAYPAELEGALTELGPTLAVAIGLARQPIAHTI